MKLAKCLLYALECKKILSVTKILMTSITVVILLCTAAKMFLLKGDEMKKMKKALKKVMQ